MTNNNTPQDMITAIVEAYCTGKVPRKSADKRKSNLRALALAQIEADIALGHTNITDINAAALASDKVQDGSIKINFSDTSIVPVRDALPYATMLALGLGMMDAVQMNAAFYENKSDKPFGLPEFLWSDSLCKDHSMAPIEDALANLNTAIAVKNEAAAITSQMALTSALINVYPFTTGTADQIAQWLKDAVETIDLSGFDAATSTDSAKTIPTINLDLDDTKKGMFDTVIGSMGSELSKVDDIKAAFAELEQMYNEATTGATGVEIKMEFNGTHNVVANQALALPSGDFELTNAKDVFGIPPSVKSFDFKVPVWKWDSEHPWVPEIDPDYQFQPDTLLPVLVNVVFPDRNLWLWGHTGTGKSTLVEQVAARLNYPMQRVNFDAHLQRMDFVGKETLTVDDQGVQVTRFQPGILPQALENPCIFLCDEVDASRPDLDFVMQRVLEGKGLMLTEDSGRVVKPHAMFRMFATANSNGKGDDTGRYMGVKAKNDAVMDRYKDMVKVDYMKKTALKKLIKSKEGANLNDNEIAAFADYTKEHWVAFEKGTINTALSPRGVLAAVEKYNFYRGLMAKEEAFERSFKESITNKTDGSDYQTMHDLFQRVSAGL